VTGAKLDPRRIMNAVVLGIGNVLLGDEGLGALATLELERRFHIPGGLEVMDGGTAGLELMPYVAGKDLLIIIDAIKSGKEPGTVVRMEGEDVPVAFRQRLSPHQLGLSDLLAATMLLEETPDRMVLFGVEPVSMETGIGLSEKVAASFERLLGLVTDELYQAGFILLERDKEDMAEPCVWAEGR